MADTITLKYTPTGGAPTTRTINVHAVRGFDVPDSFELFPGIQHRYPNGNIDGQTKGFRRRITIDFGVLQDNTDRLAILYFLLDDAREVDYATETDIRVEPRNPGAFQNKWLDDCELGRYYVLELEESIIRTAFPV